MHMFMIVIGGVFLDGVLYIVVPCYNEEEALGETAEKLLGKLLDLISREMISPDSRIMLVNDGSSDSTWSMIEELSGKNKMFCGVSLSRNRGHQNALFAGLMIARRYADMTISIDADLQDDINVIDEMVSQYNDGSDVVYGVRSSRGRDTFFKRFTAEGYYKLLRSMGCEVVFNHADYRLLSRRAMNALAQYGEGDLFLRGLVPLLGYKTSSAAYERGERTAGESKYTLKKMLTLAFDGIMGLSLRPVRIVIGSGAFMLLISLAILILSVVRLIAGHGFEGWITAVFSIWFVGGLLMVGIGVAGEYAGRALMESKKRPRYFVEKTAGIDDSNGGF